VAVRGYHHHAITHNLTSLSLSLFSLSLGQARLDKQHEKGKLTARERIDLLLDEGCGSRLSFVG
jgi:acetyl-CoA carboxylase carboxyltransferase component